MLACLAVVSMAKILRSQHFLKHSTGEFSEHNSNFDEELHVNIMCNVGDLDLFSGSWLLS